MYFTAWRSNGWLWIAGKSVSGKWMWFGRATGEILVADWEQIQPDSSNGCLQVFDENRASPNRVWENYKWDDTSCGAQRKFVCEKVK